MKAIFIIPVFILLINSIQIYPGPHPKAFIPGKQIVTNTFNDGPGSLRDAINNSNSIPGLDTIVFDLTDTIPGYNPGEGVWIFEPLTELPDITEPLLIDGFSQNIFSGSDTNPYGPEIFINGTNTQDYALAINCPGVQIRGLAIGNFISYGVYIKNHIEGCGIHGCYIGLNASGTTAMPNGLCFLNNF